MTSHVILGLLAPSQGRGRRGPLQPRLAPTAERCQARYKNVTACLCCFCDEACHFGCAGTLAGKEQRGRLRLRHARAAGRRRDGSSQTGSPFAARTGGGRRIPFCRGKWQGRKPPQPQARGLCHQSSFVGGGTGVPPVTPLPTTAPKWTRVREVAGRVAASATGGGAGEVSRARSVTRGPRLLHRRAAWWGAWAQEYRGGLGTVLPLQPSIRAHLIRAKYTTRPRECKACTRPRCNSTLAGAAAPAGPCSAPHGARECSPRRGSASRGAHGPRTTQPRTGRQNAGPSAPFSRSTSGTGRRMAL